MVQRPKTNPESSNNVARYVGASECCGGNTDCPKLARWAKRTTTKTGRYDSVTRGEGQPAAGQFTTAESWAASNDRADRIQRETTATKRAIPKRAIPKRAEPRAQPNEITDERKHTKMADCGDRGSSWCRQGQRGDPGGAG